MRKILITQSLSVLCILFSTAIFAQESKTEFGIKGGLNLARINGGVSDIHNLRPGIHAGVFAEHTFNNFIGIQGELLYSMMGDRESGSSFIYESNTYKYKHTVKNDYIVLPVLAKLYVAKKLSIDLGPQLGYMISSKEKRSINNVESSVSYYDHYEKFDVAIAVGLSYKLGNRFSVSGRCNIGLIEIYDSMNKSLNQVAQFGIGYRLK
ncbi:MAG: PorT family protein [Bacteroidales bacterium]|jgi:hypothetical protein|nr:PorT family protein [Bacteroidales bacterium]